VILYVAGVKVDSSAKHLLSYLPSAAGIALFAFDNWLWRMPGIARLHTRPRIGGLWRVVLRPDPQSHIPEGGNRGPISAYMVIDQSFWSISVTQFTAESTSHSHGTAYVRRPGTTQQQLSFTYQNEPKREHLPRSPRHVGACQIDLVADSPVTLTGTYYTDRFTAGAMSLTLIDRSTRYADFGAVEAHAANVVER
jgi:hypothetical protein